MAARLSHIGIAVRDLPDAERLFSILLNKESSHREQVADQKVNISSFETGESFIELTVPTEASSPISKFLDKRGEGIHHVAIEVDDIESELRRLKAAGFQLIDEVGRPGSHGMTIAFVHPKSTNGVLVELCQRPVGKR